ncbi:MAG: DUF3237 family protein [Clostridia bacterium]|nr:DUF3237 family protein [Clostridia bacterium]
MLKGRTAMNGDLLLEIQVRTLPSQRVNGKTRDILMIPFTGTASGPWFTGQVIGQGMDTQKISKAGKAALSARYMLEGTDKSGQSCRVFIENQGSFDTGFQPTVVTDSALLSDWETADLRATVDVVPGGVTVRVFREGARP